MLRIPEVLEQIRGKYAIETVPVKIGEKVLQIVQLKDYEEFIINQIEQHDLNVTEAPFWAKLWEASFVLAYFLGKQPVKAGGHMLEIGSGIGIVGVYAALCGHRVTITDINEDALLFAKANAMLNGLSESMVRRLDWSDPAETAQYDTIVGSEIVYDRRSYPALVDFMHRSLTPNGMIFLAKNADLPAPTFFTELTRHFAFKKTSQTLKNNGESHEIQLFAVRHKTAIRKERVSDSV
jgi:EEF1A lysine methyltransferase 3